MTEENRQRLHAFVHGRVQGVGFRHFVLMEASDIGLTGWVRNRREGSVEVVAEGDLPQLNRLIQVLHRGPGSAHVTQVDQEWLDPTGEYHRFRVRITL